MLQQEQQQNIVFDKHWFSKHQSKLIWLANSWIGKYIFQFKKMGHCLDPKKKIVKITPNSVAQLNKITGKGKKRKIELTEHFFTRNEYARKLYWYLLPVWYFMHTWDYFTADHFKLAPKLNFGFSTLTRYPGSIGSNNPIDGQLLTYGRNLTLANIRAITTCDLAETAADSIYCQLNGSTTSNQFSQLYRALLFFDTSSLTSGATISASVLSVYGNYVINNLGSPDLHIAQGNAASTSALATSDFNQANFGTTSFGSIAYASFSTAGYNDITLNASGISAVSKTGISKFSAQLSWDINNNFTGTWISGSYSYINFNSSKTSLGGAKPKLVVTYTTVAPNTNFLIMF